MSGSAYTWTMLRLALFLMLMACPALAGEWSGHAHVGDGDTIHVQGQRLRLLGIDAPESNQTCTNAQGVEYGCGESATLFLQATIRNQTVTCMGDRRDYWGRPLVVCRIGQIDLNAMLVRAGWAISAYGPAYIVQHNAAAGDRIGMWSGPFITPEQWRRGIRR